MKRLVSILVASLITAGCAVQTTVVTSTVMSIATPPLDCALRVTGAHFDPVPDWPGEPTPELAVHRLIDNLVGGDEKLAELGDYQVQSLGTGSEPMGSGLALVYLVVAEDGKQAMNIWVTEAPGDPDGHVVTGAEWCCPDSGCE